MNICGDCKRFMDCSWERNFVPVEGWKAKKVKYSEIDNYQKKDIYSYDVIDCPLFIPPNKNYKKPKKFNVKQKYLSTSKNRKAVSGVCIATGEIKTWDSIADTIKDGFKPKIVGYVANGKQGKHRGWRFWFIRASTVEKGNNNEAKGESQ